MWLLARFLPLMIGQWVPEEDENLQLYMLLLDIVDILFAPEISPEDISLLSVHIQDQHRQFKIIYPSSSIIPKMHYMVHMPEFIRQ